MWSGPITHAADLEAQAAQLAQEVSAKGWILYAAKTVQGDYDLFCSRPDGSHRRNLTRTPTFSEVGGRFAPDSKRMLYRRGAVGTEFNHDLWGATGALVIANADGSNPVPLGTDGQFPWASWSPDGKRVACLFKREGKIRIADLETKKFVAELPRQGIFQQMYWSSDGRHLCGTANRAGQDWNILGIEVATGKATLLSRNLACTGDWFQGDPRRVIYSNRIPGVGSQYGWTMLMQATADGQSRTLIYGERGRHIYYGSTSPDDQYAIFSVPETDGGMDSSLAIVRLADTPIVVPADYRELLALYPHAKPGPVLRLNQPGFEPHWTYAEIGAK